MSVPFGATTGAIDKTDVLPDFAALALDFVQDGLERPVLPACFAFSRAGGGTYSSARGRVDGLEISVRNLIWPSTNLADARWTPFLAEIDEDETIEGADGETSAVLLRETAGSGTHGIYTEYVCSNGLRYMHGCRVNRFATRRRVRLVCGAPATQAEVSFDLVTGAATLASGTALYGMAPDVNGWWSIWAMVTGHAAGTGYFQLQLEQDDGTVSYAGDVAEGVYVEAPQVSLGYAAYIPTTSGIAPAAQAASLGAKIFYSRYPDTHFHVDDAIRITPEDQTTNMLIVGTVTAIEANGVDAAKITVTPSSVGTDTSTTKSTWRLDYAGPRFEYDATGLPLGLRSDSARTNVVLHNRDLRITHQLVVTGGSGTFAAGEAVSATGGGTGLYVGSASSLTAFAIRGGSGTFTGTLTGADSGATRTISSAATVWVATNVTVTDATGVDGLPGSASRLTATSGGGTVLQAITLASSARCQAAKVRRVTGTDVISMTMDNGSTWVAIVPTADWTLIPIPTQTLSNPTVGFRFALSGDVIEVDVVQNENGIEATSSIPTTYAAVARAPDLWDILTADFPFNPAAGRIVVTYTKDGDTGGVNIWQLDDGTISNRLFLRAVTSGGAVVTRLDMRYGGAQQAALADAPTSPAGSVIVADASWRANDFRLSTGAGAATPDTSVSVPAVTTLRNSSNTGTVQLGGHHRSLVYYPVP